MHIQLFDTAAATQVEWQAFNQFDNAMQNEIWPDDPPTPIERTIAGWRDIPDFTVLKVWAVWNDTEMVGRGTVRYWRAEHNQHIAMCNVAVLPAYRRQGIGRRLLPYLIDFAEGEGKREIIGWTEGSNRAATAFCELVGAKQGIVSSTNQLNLSDLDQDLMHRWVERAQHRAVGFSLGYWDGPIPDADIDGFIRVMDAMNDAPRPDGWEDETWTVDQIRAWEATQEKQGKTHWTVYAREEATGVIAGYSDVFWDPLKPTVLSQNDTGVLPAYRNLGLGRWLKAAMILRVLQALPQVRYVRTGNADANAPMLSINYAMGFKPARSWVDWQLDVAQARAFVDGQLVAAGIP